jgi:uncharacterized protein YaaR (DUF327 family)
MMREKGRTVTKQQKSATAEKPLQPSSLPPAGEEATETQALNPDVVAAAVLQLIRMAIEHEHRLARDVGISRDDGHAQREVHRILETDSRLQTIVTELLKYQKNSVIW